MSWLTVGFVPLVVKRKEVSDLGVEKWKFSGALGRALEKDREDDKPDYTRLRPSIIANLHVVDFVNEALGIIKPTVSIISRRLKLTFLIGKSVHDWIQVCIANNKEEMYGDWECEKCRDVDRGLRIELVACKKCGGLIWSYKEPFLEYSEGSVYSVGGHPDIILVKKTEKMACVVDIKTSNDMWFNNLGITGPSIEHIVQVMVYMWLVELETKYETEGRLYYINKNDASEKEFGIKVSSDVIQRVLKMRKFFSTCMIEKRIWTSFDLTDMNKSIIEVFGKDCFLDYWYPVD